MGKYGYVATLAAGTVAKGAAIAPRDAWNAAAARVFPDSPSSQAKGCPRDTFLALCDLGAIHGVLPGQYTRSVKNRSYAVRALAALRANEALCDDPSRLWRMVTRGETKVANHQMDVVTTLWREGLIRQAPRSTR